MSWVFWATKTLSTNWSTSCLCASYIARAFATKACGNEAERPISLSPRHNFPWTKLTLYFASGLLTAFADDLKYFAQLWHVCTICGYIAKVPSSRWSVLQCGQRILCKTLPARSVSIAAFAHFTIYYYEYFLDICDNIEVCPEKYWESSTDISGYISLGSM